MGFIRLKECILFFLAAAAALWLPWAQCQNGTAWTTEVVDTAQSGDARTFSSLVIDRFGNFHLVYSNRAGTTLRYAFRTKQAKRWDTTTVDTVGGSFESLAVDSHGWGHIAYNSPKFTGLHYAYWDGNEWQTFVIDSERTNQETSIQVDSSGNPRISYYRAAYPDGRNAKYLKYAYFDGKTWYIQTVDHRSNTGRWNSIALDPADRPYISYSMTSTGELGLAHLDKSGWQHTEADSRTSKSQQSSVDCDSALVISDGGDLRIVYVNALARSINYAWQQGEVWHRETVDSLVSPGSDADRVSLKLDRNGRPHVVYYDSGLAALKYATRDEKGWHTETIDNGNGGEHPSLSLDENGHPYVAYYAANARELRVAHRANDSLQKR